MRSISRPCALSSQRSKRLGKDGLEQQGIRGGDTDEGQCGGVCVHICFGAMVGALGYSISPQGSICQQHFPVCKNGPGWHRYVGVGRNHQAPVPERKNS